MPLNLRAKADARNLQSSIASRTTILYCIANLMKALQPTLALLLATLSLHAQESSLKNPTKREYKNESVRLLAPGPAGSFIVKSEGKEIPYQVEEIGGKNWIWVLGDFAPGASQKYSVSPGKPAEAKLAVDLRKEGDVYVLDNGQVSVKVRGRSAG